jgi:hypothetical protein
MIGGVGRTRRRVLVRVNVFRKKVRLVVDIECREE